MRILPGLLAGLGLLFLLGSCATGGVGGPPGCRSNLSSHQESLNELVDSAALQDRLEAIWAPVDGLVLGWIRFDSTGATDTVGIRTESLSEAQRTRMEEALLSAVVSSPGKKSGTNLFLGDAEGPAVRRLSRVQACKPQVRNEEMLSEAMEEVGRELGLRELRQAIFHAFVLADGTVDSVLGPVNTNGKSVYWAYGNHRSPIL